MRAECCCAQEPSRKLHPTIWHAKELLRQFSREQEVVMFCDLHGHSQKKDIFAYGAQKEAKDMTASVPGR